MDFYLSMMALVIGVGLPVAAAFAGIAVGGILVGVFALVRRRSRSRASSTLHWVLESVLVIGWVGLCALLVLDEPLFFIMTSTALIVLCHYACSGTRAAAGLPFAWAGLVLAVFGPFFGIRSGLDRLSAPGVGLVLLATGVTIVRCFLAVHRAKPRQPDSGD